MRQTSRPTRTKTYALRVLKGIYWTIFAISLLIVAAYVGFTLFAKEPEIKGEAPSEPPVSATDDPATPTDESAVSPAPDGLRRRESCHTFLLLGMDDGNGNTDTIMALTYDIPNQRVSVASIPRDTLVDVPRTVKKINAAYSVGGIEGVQGEVSRLLGYPVDHYIIVDLRAFKALVDAVGGVDFNVPVDMNYDDPVQDLHIHLKAGNQHLDGAKALQLVRFRSGYSNADIGRVNTQQQFLKVLAKKVLSWGSITKINDFVQIFSEYVKTDLTVGNLAYFAAQALELDTETGVTMDTLPGNGLVSYKGIDYYYELYPEETLEIINGGLNPYNKNISLEMAHIFQVPPQ